VGHGFEHFQVDCLNRKTLSLGKWKRFRSIKDVSSEEEDSSDVPMLITLDVGELLSINKSLPVT